MRSDPVVEQRARGERDRPRVAHRDPHRPSGYQVEVTATPPGVPSSSCAMPTAKCAPKAAQLALDEPDRVATFSLLELSIFTVPSGATILEAAVAGDPR